MIKQDLLLGVKKIVCHKFCHDGTSSAMILKDVLHNCEVFFAGHKDKEYLELKAEPGLLFCDISPPPERENEFLEQSSIVIDHHIKTIDVVRKFEVLGLGKYGETDDGVSGAVLAFEEVWLPLQELAKTDRYYVQRLSRLAGIRDTFQTSSAEWEDALDQTEAIAFYPAQHFLENHPAYIFPEEMKIGNIINARNKENISRIDSYSYTHSWINDGKLIKVGIVPGHKSISDSAEELRKRGIPITISFGFKMSEHGIPLLMMSARSDGSFDCNKFAQYFHGGGHVKAAGGMQKEIYPGSENPYDTIGNMINTFGKECLI